MVYYKLISRPNPLDESAPAKFYATTVSKEAVDIKTLAKTISMLSTVSRTDCVAVLTAFLEVIPMELLRGNLVRLGDLGTLRLTVQSEGVENEGDFSPSKIKKTRVRFLAGKELKKTILGAEFSVNS